MLESLKASLFLFSFFFFLPSIVLEKALLSPSAASCASKFGSSVSNFYLSDKGRAKERTNPTIRSSNRFLIIELRSFVIRF